MPKPSNEARAEKARQSLITTIAKIHDLEPTMGGKWRANMLSYYVNRLAELLLYQLGFTHPSEQSIHALANQIRDILEVGPD